MNIKIALVSPFPPPFGGMTVLAETLYDCLTKHGCSVVKINTHPGSSSSITIFSRFLPTIKFYLSLTKIFNCDVIVIISSSGAFFFLKAFPVLLLGKLFGKPVILDFVGGGIQDKLKDGSQVWPKLLNMFDSVIVPTTVFYDLFSAHGIKCLVLPHVVDIHRFTQKNSQISPPVLLSAKNLEGYSGISTIIRAVSEVQKSIPDITLLIAGDGPEKVNLQKLVSELETNHVEFLGNVTYDEMPALFERTTILVHGTQYESFGIVLVEAFASGTPIVSTDVGGIPGLVKNGFSGFLVNYNDNKAMADKIILLLNNQELYREMQQNCIKSSREYSCDSLGPRLVQLIKEVMGNNER